MLNDGPAKRIIEGLSVSANDCTEAIQCLVKCYNQPSVFHQAHVWAISEAPVFKDGCGKELQLLHVMCSQHCSIEGYEV